MTCNKRKGGGFQYIPELDIEIPGLSRIISAVRDTSFKYAEVYRVA